MTEKSVVDILLQSEIPTPAVKKVEVKRLSKHCGERVLFTIKQLPYAKVAEIKKSGSEDIALDILLAGVAEPNLKDKTLAAKYGEAPTPAELVKTMLLPGEVEEISMEIEKLCGYIANNVSVVEDVKKN